MDLAEIDANYLKGICEELQLPPKAVTRLFSLWARKQTEKLRKALIEVSREATRPCGISCDGSKLVELAEEGALL